jgi:hypothetical protein
MKQVLIPAIVVVLLSAGPAGAVAPGDTLWTRVYGGQYNESAFCIRPTSDGGYITTGYTYTFGPGGYDVYILKTDASGDTLWTRAVGGSGGDYGNSVVETFDGGYVVAGRSESTGPGSSGAFLTKVTASGDSLWSSSFGGAGYDHLNFIDETSDSGLIVTGRSTSFGAGDEDLYLVKTNASGDTLWMRTYGGSGWDEGYCVHQTPDGGFVVVGYTDSFGGAGEDIWLLRTDAGGDTLWTKLYGGPIDVVARSVAVTSDQGFIVAGNTDQWGGTADGVLVKTDSAGMVEWAKLYGWDSDQYFHSVASTSDGGYIAAGYGWTGGDGWYDAYVVKTDASGAVEWENTYGGAQDEHAQFVTESQDGGYVVCGDTRSYGAGAGDVYILGLAGPQPLPDVSIAVWPDTTPLIVPKGGSFGFSGTLVNNSDGDVTVDVWTMAMGPWKYTFGPFKLYEGVEMGPGDSLSAHLVQAVPRGAPPGDYSYIAYTGFYPGEPADSSLFEGEVIEASGSE